MNLALVLCVAALATVAFQRLKQPIVLGYILAGLIVGPHVPVPLVADPEVVDALAELGVILLMFSLGLEFRLAKLMEIAPNGGLVAIVEVSLMASLGYLVGWAFGWTPMECLFTGAAVSISSTSIIAKAFEEQGVRGRRRELVFGILIAEDLLAILLMVALSILASGQELSVGQLGTAALRLGASLGAILVGGLLLVPRLFRYIVALGRPETTTVAAVGLCFALALASESLGYPAALGAFLGGMLVAESGHGALVEHTVQPVRDVFAALFFVAVGMMIDPALVFANLGAVVVLCVLVLVGKVVAVSLGAFLAGNGSRASVQAGMSLAQIGEFSFLLVGVGVTLGATRDFLYPVAIAVSAVTAFATPAFVRRADWLAARIDRHLPARLQTLGSLYGAWLEELSTAPPSEGRRTRIRGLVRVLVLDAAALVAVVVVNALFGGSVAAWAGARFAIDVTLARWLVVIVALVHATPLVIGLVGATGRLAEAIAAPMLGGDGAAARREMLETMLHLGLLLVVGLPLLAFTQPFLPPFRGVAVLLLVLLGLAVLLWRRASVMQGEVRSGALSMLEAVRRHAASEAPEGAAAPVPTAVLGSALTLRLEPGDAAVGRTLIAMDLRSLTGASVIGVTSPSGEAGVPTGRETLLAGSVLAVAGTRDAVEAARLLLREGALAADEGAPA